MHTAYAIQYAYWLLYLEKLWKKKKILDPQLAIWA